MRLDNIKIQMEIDIPFGVPDKNGVIYSKEAVRKAVEKLRSRLPIIYRDNGSYKDEVVIGNTIDEECAIIIVLDNEVHQACKVIINGNINYGGLESIVNEIKDGVVTDFDITAIGISR